MSGKPKIEIALRDFVRVRIWATVNFNLNSGPFDHTALSIISGSRRLDDRAQQYTMVTSRVTPEVCKVYVKLTYNQLTDKRSKNRTRKRIIVLSIVCRYSRWSVGLLTQHVCASVDNRRQRKTRKTWLWLPTARLEPSLRPGVSHSLASLKSVSFLRRPPPSRDMPSNVNLVADNISRRAREIVQRRESARPAVPVCVPCN